MSTGFALLVIAAGLVRKEWVRDRRAFGWGIAILFLLAAVYGAERVLTWPSFRTEDVRFSDWSEAIGNWFASLKVADALLTLAFMATMVRAYWPFGERPEVAPAPPQEA